MKTKLHMDTNSVNHNTTNVFKANSNIQVTNLNIVSFLTLHREYTRRFGLVSSTFKKKNKLFWPFFT